MMKLRKGRRTTKINLRTSSDQDPTKTTISNQTKGLKNGD